MALALFFDPTGVEHLSQLRVDVSGLEDTLVSGFREGITPRLASLVRKLARDAKFGSRLLNSVLTVAHPVAGIGAHLGR